MVNEILMSSMFWVIAFAASIWLVQGWATKAVSGLGLMADVKLKQRAALVIGVALSYYLALFIGSILIFGLWGTVIGYWVGMIAHWAAMQVPGYKRLVIAKCLA